MGQTRSRALAGNGCPLAAMKTNTHQHLVSASKGRAWGLTKQAASPDPCPAYRHFPQLQHSSGSPEALAWPSRFCHSSSSLAVVPTLRVLPTCHQLLCLLSLSPFPNSEHLLASRNMHPRGLPSHVTPHSAGPHTFLLPSFCPLPLPGEGPTASQPSTTLGPCTHLFLVV